MLKGQTTVKRKFTSVDWELSMDGGVEVLYRLLDGDSMRAIGKHMNLSSTTIFRVRNNILKQMMK